MISPCMILMRFRTPSGFSLEFPEVRFSEEKQYNTLNSTQGNYLKYSACFRKTENLLKSLPFSQEFDIVVVWCSLKILSVVQPNTYKIILVIVSLGGITCF